MSVWSENPEWFDDWLTEQAENGRFGPTIEQLAHEGNFIPWEWWDKLDNDGTLGQDALTAYVESRIP